MRLYTIFLIVVEGVNEVCQLPGSSSYSTLLTQWTDLIDLTLHNVNYIRYQFT